MKLHRDGARLLQLLIFNEECLVSAIHQIALITSLPFVHTARRSYRLNDPVRPPDCGAAAGSPAATPREAVRTLSFRGRRSRNKVSVGEPAEGSLNLSHPHRWFFSTPAALASVSRRPRVSARLFPGLEILISLPRSGGLPAASLTRSGGRSAKPPHIQTKEPKT